MDGKSIVDGNFGSLKLGAYGAKAVIKYNGNNNVQRLDWLVTWDMLSLVVVVLFSSFFFVHQMEPWPDQYVDWSTSKNFAFTQENNETINIMRTMYSVHPVKCIHSYSYNIRPRKYLHYHLVKTIEKMKTKEWKQKKRKKQREKK